jgi:hypothetical protein
MATSATTLATATPTTSPRFGVTTTLLESPRFGVAVALLVVIGMLCAEVSTDDPLDDGGNVSCIALVDVASLLGDVAPVTIVVREATPLIGVTDGGGALGIAGLSGGVRATVVVGVAFGVACGVGGTGIGVGAGDGVCVGIGVLGAGVDATVVAGQIDDVVSHQQNAGAAAQSMQLPSAKYDV